MEELCKVVSVETAIPAAIGSLFGSWFYKKVYPKPFDFLMFYMLGTVLSIASSPVVASLWKVTAEGKIVFISLVLGLLGAPIASSIIKGVKASNWWSLIMSRYGRKKEN
ncbi:hypothetical protein LJC19_04675 [Oxalobacter sp. OttesenSCG-928-P03]|nr:hypothetical protein [Oxalobacter sp. OttesenSCG-928-P03]